MVQKYFAASWLPACLYNCAQNNLHNGRTMREARSSATLSHLLLLKTVTKGWNNGIKMGVHEMQKSWKLTFYNCTTLPYIQGVSRLADFTAGGDFLGLCEQKSSYKHVSDFGQLQSYRHFLVPVHALVWTTSYGTSRRVMYSTWWLIVCGSCNKQLTRFATERQPVLRPAVTFSKTGLKHR